MSDDNIYSVAMPAGPLKCAKFNRNPSFINFPYVTGINPGGGTISRPATHADLLNHTANFYIDYYVPNFTLPNVSGGQWVSLRPAAYGNLLVADYRLAPIPAVAGEAAGCKPITNIIATFISTQEAVTAGLAISSQIFGQASVLVKVEYYVDGSLALVLEAKRLCSATNNEWDFVCTFKDESFAFPAACDTRNILGNPYIISPLRAYTGSGNTTVSSTLSIQGAAANGTVTRSTSSFVTPYRYWPVSAIVNSSIQAEASNGEDCPSDAPNPSSQVGGTLDALYLNGLLARGSGSMSCRNAFGSTLVSKQTDFGGRVWPPSAYDVSLLLQPKPDIFATYTVDIPRVPPPAGSSLTIFIDSGTCSFAID
jgi:hypothetical protein